MGINTTLPNSSWFEKHTVALMLEWVLSRFSHAEHSLPGSSAHGILQARVLEWVAIPFSRGSSWWRDQTWVFCAAGGFFTTEPLGKPYRGMISPHNNGHVTDHRYHLLHIKNLGYRWDDLGEWHWNMYNIIYEMNHQSMFDAWYWMLGAGALGWPRRMVWGGKEWGSGWGTHVYLWWIHVDIWKNQYKIVNLKIKIIRKKILEGKYTVHLFDRNLFVY